VSSNREIAVVQADYLALANDLEQAQALASSLEIQLSGKSNELARFKVIWEHTQANLAKFEQDLDQLRKERHALANEVQRAQAFEFKHEKLNRAHGELLAKCERLEAELSGERAAHASTRDEFEQLRDGLAPCAPARTGGGGGLSDASLRQSLHALRTQIDRVLGGPGTSVEPPAKAEDKAAHGRIDIQFA
jgi:chromosome segregation ATPase